MRRKLKTSDNVRYQHKLWRNRKRYQDIRKAVIDRDVYCQSCLRRGQHQGQRILRPVDHVDHITPPAGDYDLFHNPNNLQGLCVPCHEDKTRIEKACARKNKSDTGEISRPDRTVAEAEPEPEWADTYTGERPQNAPAWRTW